VVSGIVGSPTDHHGVRYTLTEEFVAVYRMHSLMRDDFSFRAHDDNRLLRTTSLPEVSASNTHLLYADVPFVDVVYSLGTEHPGALALHNYPRHLQHLRRQDSGEPRIGKVPGRKAGASNPVASRCAKSAVVGPSHPRARIFHRYRTFVRRHLGQIQPGQAVAGCPGAVSQSGGRF
jgi:hypothetical protein